MGEWPAPAGRPICKSVSIGEVERLFVVALPAAQRGGRTGDESADDERERTQ